MKQPETQETNPERPAALAGAPGSAWRNPETDPPTSTGKILVWVRGVGPAIVNVEERWMAYWDGSDETEMADPDEWDAWANINKPKERLNAATRWGQVTPAEAAKPTKTKDMNTTQSPTELAAVPCSAFDAAMALISLGPQRRANAVEWCRVSLEMCKHCKGTENVNEAAARIVAERMKTYDRKLRLLTKEQHRMRDPERTLLCDIIANGQLLPDPNGSRYGQNDAGQRLAP